MIPDTIPCDAEHRDPDTGGVSGCEPRLIGVDVERVSAVYEHDCGRGIEVADVEDLTVDDIVDWRTRAMLADAAASAVARDEVVGEIVEEECPACEGQGYRSVFKGGITWS